MVVQAGCYDMVGSINSHRLNVINYGLTFCHLSVSLWRILPVFSVTMPASVNGLYTPFGSPVSRGTETF